MTENWKARTKAVHAGARRSQYGELSEAIFLTQGFVYDSAEQAEARFVKAGEDEFIYARYGNPTVAMFEDRIASLEGVEAGFATASGMAAVNGALMALVKAGDHVVSSRALFGSCLYILEDVLGAIAFLITKDDGISPIIRIDDIGKHDVAAGSSQQAIMTSLVLKPLAKIGLQMTDVDKYSTELHNPEITLPAGSGDTPATNYKIMAALAVLNNEIHKSEMDSFVRERGMPGYSPTQGHVPSAVPFIGHAIEAMKRGEMKRAMFVAKGSLFLGRMSQLSDGLSFLLEANDSKHVASDGKI